MDEEAIIRERAPRYYLRLNYPVRTLMHQNICIAAHPDLPGCEVRGLNPRDAFIRLEKLRQRWIYNAISLPTGAESQRLHRGTSQVSNRSPPPWTHRRRIMNASVSSAIVATIVAVTVTIGVSLRRPYRGIYGQFGAFSFAIGLWHLGILLEGFADNVELRLQLLAGSWLPAFTLKFFITLLQDKGRLANRSLRFSFVVGILGLSNLFVPAGVLFYTAIPIAGIVVLSSAVALQLLAPENQDNSVYERTYKTYFRPVCRNNQLNSWHRAALTGTRNPGRDRARGSHLLCVLPIPKCRYTALNEPSRVSE